MTVRLHRPAPGRAARAAALPLLLLAGGCRAVGPDYARPGVELPATFRDADAVSPAGPAAASFADLPWWRVFEDPVLQEHLRTALAGNEDLRAALARVAEARARAGIAAADRFPQVEAGLTGSRDRASRELGGSGSRTTNTFRASVSASWEIDLWGRVRRGEEAAVAEWMASEEGRRAVVVTLVGDVAEAYFDLRELDEELVIAQETRDARRKTLSLFSERALGGVSSKLETAQAQADLAFAEAAVPDIARRVAQQENLISFLLGRTPGPVARGVSLGTRPLPPALPTGLPAALLERRPDVRAAEAEVRAANARVGVAMAEFFPRLDLLALLGLGARDLSDLAGDRATYGSLGGTFLGPVFQGGRLVAGRDAAQARYDEAVARFRRTVESAFRDVADQLAAVRGAREVRIALEQQVAALTEALDLSSTRYGNGVAAYFEVLDAQRALFPARIELARTRRDQYVALIRLYRALGGGWADEGCGVPTPTAPAAPGPSAAGPAASRDRARRRRARGAAARTRRDAHAGPRAGPAPTPAPATGGAGTSGGTPPPTPAASGALR
ncbi:MAG: efflux transporter outer membrane subunit [Planctomycetota bacterium]